MSNSKMQNQPDVELFFHLMEQKLKSKKSYTFKIFNCEKLICYLGVYEGQDLIMTSHVFLMTLNQMIGQLFFNKKEILESIFDAGEVQSDAY